MSYYTYFTIPKNYRDSRDENAIKRDMGVREMSLKRSKNELRAAMIDAYYSKSYKESANLINIVWSGIIYDMTTIENYNTALWARELKDGSTEYNHANCDSLYEVQDNLQDDQNTLDTLYGDLLCLSRVRFKDESDYTDDPHTERDYLLYEYQNKITDIIDNAQSIIEEMSKYKIWIDCWDTKKTETELEEEYEKAHPEESNIISTKGDPFDLGMMDDKKDA